jgi:hypothetical protein
MFHTFTKFQFVEDGCLSGSIKAHHQDAHFFFAELIKRDLRRRLELA